MARGLVAGMVMVALGGIGWGAASHTPQAAASAALAPPPHGAGQSRPAPTATTAEQDSSQDPFGSATRPAPPAAEPTSVAAPRGWTTTTYRLAWDGVPRDYAVVRPEVTTSPLPVLVLLHGRGMAPAAMAQVTGFPGLVGPAIYVYPAGVGGSWNAGSCCGPAHLAGVDDVGFLTAMVKRVLTSNPDAAPDGVYLAGFSNGGRMAWRMACAAPQLFTAVASVEAVSVYPCARAGPVPFIEVASTDDPLLTISPGQPAKTVDGLVQPTVDATMATWRSLMGCRSVPAGTVDGSLVATSWERCDGGARVGLALYRGGGHSWPRGDAMTPSATRVIWTFFSATPGRLTQSVAPAAA